MDAGSPPLGQHDHSLFLLRRSSREGWRKEICKYVRRGEARQTHGRAAGVRQRQQRFHAEFLPVAEREDEEPEHCLLAPEYHIRIKYGERVQAAVETKSPVIMQVSKGARNYANATILRYMAEGAVAYAKELGCEKPEIVLHLDHGDSFELCKDCIDMGFSSVMYDGSSLPYEENIKISRQVVEYAHKYDVTVECELGVLAGVQGCCPGRKGLGHNGCLQFVQQSAQLSQRNLAE